MKKKAVSRAKKVSGPGINKKPEPLIIFSRYLFFFLYLIVLIFMISGSRFSGRKYPGPFQLSQSLPDLHRLLPEFDNQPYLESFRIADKKIYPAWKKSALRVEASAEVPGSAESLTESFQLAGFAFSMSGRRGSSTAELMLGVDVHDRLTGVHLARHQDTLGWASSRSELLLQLFRGHSLEDLEAVRVKQDPLLYELVWSGLEFYHRYRVEIFDQAAAVQPSEAENP